MLMNAVRLICQLTLNRLEGGNESLKSKQSGEGNHGRKKKYNFR